MSAEMPKLPEPMSDHEVSAMFQYWHNEHGTTWADLIRRVEKLTFEKAALHYDNVAQEAARQAMETAAAECLNLKATAFFDHAAKDACQACANSIRLLPIESEKQHG